MHKRMNTFSTQQTEYPTFSTQQIEYPSFSTQQIEYPSFSTQQIEYPTFSTQQIEYPSFSTQQIEYPSFSTQQIEYPSFSTQQIEYPSANIEIVNCAWQQKRSGVLPGWSVAAGHGAQMQSADKLLLMGPARRGGRYNPRINCCLIILCKMRQAQHPPHAR
jgi:hypothetical protein